MESYELFEKFRNHVYETGRLYQVSRINVASEMFKELADDFNIVINWMDNHNIESQDFVTLIINMNECFETSDFIGVSDILLYEIKPVIGEIVEYIRGVGDACV